MSYSHTPPRVDGREENTRDPVPEQAEEQPLPDPSASESFAMGQIKQLSSDGCDEGFIMYCNATFFGQVAFHPHIMVTGKDMYLYSAVSQRGKPAQKPCESFRDHLLVLPPEIKHVAQQPDRLCIF